MELKIYIIKVTYVLATMPDENSDTIRLMNTPKPAGPRSRVNKEQNGANTSEAVVLRRQSTQNLSSAG